MNLNISCKLQKQLYTHNNKKYLKIMVDNISQSNIEAIHDSRGHLLSRPNVDNPLDKNILCVKVPYRYNRIMCKTTGTRVIHELNIDDTFKATIQYCGTWGINDYCGHAWKLIEIIT